MTDVDMTNESITSSLNNKLDIDVNNTTKEVQEKLDNNAKLNKENVFIERTIFSSPIEINTDSKYADTRITFKQDGVDKNGDLINTNQSDNNTLGISVMAEAETRAQFILNRNYLPKDDGKPFTIRESLIAINIGREDYLDNNAWSTIALGLRSDNWPYFKLSGVNDIHPNASDLTSLGLPEYKFTQLYASSGTINTSDERVKQQIQLIPDEVLDAWGEVNFYEFKFNDAVEKKEENARTHAGLIAQRIKEIFEKHNLDPFKYGLLCYDKWEKRYEGDNILEEGDLYSIRYDEALCMEAAYHRRELQKLNAKLDTLLTNKEQGNKK